MAFPTLFLALISSSALLFNFPSPSNIANSHPTSINGIHDSPALSSPINGHHDSLKLILEAALEVAIDSLTSASSLGPKFKDNKERAAWADCLELYDLMASHLNETLTHPTCTRVDAQTWLSSASTLLETCKTGFDDLGAKSGLVLPLMAYSKISHLISKALALNNKNNTRSSSGQPNGFSKGSNWRLSKSSLVDIVVAKDGSGNYKTVGEAMSDAAGRKSSVVIYVKGGVYGEYLRISREDVTLMGDGIGKTIITGGRSVGGGYTTFDSATVGVTGSNFIAKGITFRNTAGAAKGQAVAFRSSSDLSAFYRCSFEGYQDTLFVHANRQFYRDCDIYGTVDFVFGNAAVVLQGCNLYARYPPGGTNVLTAQGRTDPNQNTGISVHRCRVAAAADLAGRSGVKTYLGRPWKKYSRAVFMETHLPEIVAAAGWLEWRGKFALDTLYYGEYKNTGPGSLTAGRVKWEGYHVIKSAVVAREFTVGRFISGGMWLPETHVPYTNGL